MSARSPSSREQLQRLGVAAADETHRARHLLCELGEALLGDWVAVDRHQRPARPQALGDQARVATAAEGAVDRDLTRLGIQDIDQLTREHGDMGGGHVNI